MKIILLACTKTNTCYLIPLSLSRSWSAAAVTSEGSLSLSSPICVSSRCKAASARSVSATNFSVSCCSSFSLRELCDALRKTLSKRRHVASFWNLEFEFIFTPILLFCTMFFLWNLSWKCNRKQQLYNVMKLTWAGRPVLRSFIILLSWFRIVTWMFCSSWNVDAVLKIINK